MQNTNKIIDVFVEISKGSVLKYEEDEKLNYLRLDRIVQYQYAYPFNYGYVPNTKCPDGGTLDVFILMDEALNPGTYIKCKIIGGIEYSDEKGEDSKLLVCPTNYVDPRFTNINNIEQISPETISKLYTFLENYKNNLNIKTVVGKLLNYNDAVKMYEKYKSQYIYDQCIVM